MSATPTPFVIPTDETSLLKNLAGGGIGAVVLGVLFLLYRIFGKRGCRSRSGCISFELATPKESTTTKHQEEHFHIELPPVRTPCPSVNSTVLEHPEIMKAKENVAS